MTRYLLFDSSCEQCTDVASGVEEASGQTIRALSLYAPEAKRLLERAGAAGTFEATLIDDDGAVVRAYTGLGLRTHMLTFLSPLKILRIARVVQRAGAPLFGRGEAREPDPRVAAEWAAAEATVAAEAEAARAPGLGEPAPIDSLTTTEGATIELGAGRRRPAMLVFLSTACGFCLKLAEILPEFVADAPEQFVLIFGDTEPAALQEFIDRYHLHDLPIVVSQKARDAFGIVGVPFGYALGADGLIRGFGIINSDEHLDSLVNTLHVSVGALKHAITLGRQV